MNIRNHSGQAIIELCVCLVAIVTVLVAMLQLATLTMMQTDTMTEARAKAADMAMSDTLISESPYYMETWDVAADGKRYTRDDDAVNAASGPFYGNFIEKSVSDATEWNVFSDSPNIISTMHNSPAQPSTYFGLVKGDASQTTNLLSAFKNLIYSADSITVESEVWMTWTKGIY